MEKTVGDEVGERWSWGLDHVNQWFSGQVAH